MTSHYWKNGLAALGLAGLIGGASPHAAANEGVDRAGATVPANPFDSAIPDNPFRSAIPDNPFRSAIPDNPFGSAVPDNPFDSATAESHLETTEAEPRRRAAATSRAIPGGAGTALDTVARDDSADPLSSVPDHQTLAEDQAAERRRARVQERVRAREERVRARQERATAREARVRERVEERARDRELRELVRAEDRSRRRAARVTRRERAETVAMPTQPAMHMPAPPSDTMATTRDRRSTAHLAEEAVAEPTPISSDHTIRVLDEALADERAEVATESASAATGIALESSGAPRPGDVHTAVADIVPAIRACARDRQGHTVAIRAIFLSSGRVGSAVVDASSPQIAAAERSCMARAARNARTPEFEAERFEVTYSVRL